MPKANQKLEEHKSMTAVPSSPNKVPHLAHPEQIVVHLADCDIGPTRHGNPKQVLLRSGSLPGITQIAVATFPECIETDFHSHPTMYEVYFVLDGRAIYTIGNDMVEVGPGDFFFVPPGVIHNQRVTSAPHRIFYWGIELAFPTVTTDGMMQQ